MFFRKKEKEIHKEKRIKTDELYNSYMENRRFNDLSLCHRDYEYYAQRGNVPSMVRTADLYYYGYSCYPNQRLARFWYQRAAEKDDQYAKDRLRHIQDAKNLKLWDSQIYLEAGDANAKIGNDIRAGEHYIKAIQHGSVLAKKRMLELVKQNRVMCDNVDLKLTGVPAEHYIEACEAYLINGDYQRVRNLISSFVDLGFSYLEKNDYLHGIPFLEAISDCGIPEVQGILGIAFFMGRGTEIDLTKALSYLTEASEDGFDAATEFLNEIHDYNTCYNKAISAFEQKDYDTSFPYFLYLARSCYHTSYPYLGHCYAYGHGTQKNDEYAYYWLKKAEQEHHELPDEVWKQLDRSEIESLHQEVQSYLLNPETITSVESVYDKLKTCTEYGVVDCMIAMGDFLHYGYFENSPAKPFLYYGDNYQAREWYRKALKCGSSDALFRLRFLADNWDSFIQFNGMKLIENYQEKKGIQYLLEAADRGIPDAYLACYRYYSDYSLKIFHSPSAYMFAKSGALQNKNPEIREVCEHHARKYET